MCVRACGAGGLYLAAQIGCYVPAAHAVMHPVDAVACRIGAGDGIAAGVSTFLAEMSDAAAALRRATPRTLLIMDELGRGTSTAGGGEHGIPRP